MVAIRIVRNWAALAATLVLAGCAAPGVERSGAQVTVDQRPMAGEGHVLLRMQSARPSTLFNPKWQMLRVERDGGQMAELVDISAMQAPGSLFYARLPAGTYRVAEVQSIGPGPGLILAIMAGDQRDLRARELRFTVREGALANLGTVVDSPPVDRDPKTRRVVLLRSALGQASALEALRLRTGQAITLPQGGGWLGEETAQEAERALRRARALVSVLAPGEDALGSVVIGGTALGQVLLRDATGQWRSEPIDSLANVTYARRLADGTLIAGTDQGRFLVRRGTGNWRSVPLHATSASVLHVEPHGHDQWLVTAQDAGVIAVHRVFASGQPPVRVAAMDPEGGLFPGVLASADRLVLTWNKPAFARESRMTILDKRTLKVETRDEKYLVFGYQRLRGGEVVMDRYSGLSHYVSFSSDGGRNWRHGQVEAPIWPWFVDAKRGYALDFKRGMFSVDSFVVRTLDGGQTWTQTGANLSEEVAGRIIGIGPDNAIVASLGWEIRSSRDEGKTWQRELPRLLD